MSASWPLIVDLFNDVCDLPLAEREARLAAMGEQPVDVLEELRTLLKAHDEVGERFSQPASMLLDETTRTEPLPEIVPGTVLGAYEIVKRIGEGGMGTVYEAIRRDDTRQRVAIKTIGRATTRSDLITRFANERRILGSLQHKNIAALYDAAVTPDGTPYFVMEFVDGRPIDLWCNAHKLEVRDRLTLFRQVCSAVQHAHAKLVVHRDLKPDNILVTADGTVKLLDFGIAKLLDTAVYDWSRTVTGYAPLTAAYASPEQLRGDAVGTATDVYSLGALLHRLLSGVIPFSNVQPMSQFFEAVMHTPAVPPSELVNASVADAIGISVPRLRAELEGEIDAIVLMALRKEPERRYSSAEALNADLQRYLSGRPISARPDTAFYRLRKFVGRQRTLVTALALATVAIGTATTVAFVQRAHAQRDATRAQRISQFLQDVLTAGSVSRGDVRRLSANRLTLPELLDSAAAQLPRQMDDDPEARVSLHAMIGMAYMEQSERAKGIAQIDSAISVEAQRGRSHSEATATLLVLRSSVTAELRPDSAAIFATRALAIFAENRTLDTSAAYVRAWRTLATVQSALGQIAPAESTFQRVISLERRRGTGGQYGLATSLGSVGMAQHNRGSYDSAAANMREAVKAYDEASSAPSVEEAMQLYSLSTHLISRGKQQEALPYLLRAKTMAVKALPPNNAVFMQLGITLADVQSFLGDTAAAHAEARNALAMIPNLPDGSQVQAFITEWWYARMLRREHNWRMAEAAARQQFASGVQSATSFPHYLSDSYWLLGATLSDVGKYAEAEPLIKQSTVIAETKIGPTTPRALRGRRDLAVLLLRSGRAGEAAPILVALPPLTADSARQMGAIKLQVRAR
ncbi:MAG: serine/threonine-protein kinase [Gemmatimonas sp.]